VSLFACDGNHDCGCGRGGHDYDAALSGTAGEALAREGAALRKEVREQRMLETVVKGHGWISQNVEAALAAVEAARKEQG